MPMSDRSQVFRRSVAALGASVLLAAAGAALARGSWGHYHREWRGQSYGGSRSDDGQVFEQSRALPNPQLTPGATSPAVTQANIGETICVRGYTRTIRPPEEYTERLKREQIDEYGYTDHRLGAYEEDHLLCRVNLVLRKQGSRQYSRTVPGATDLVLRKELCFRRERGIHRFTA